MSPATDRLSQDQRDALWKWRWLGWKNSTPAFKASLVILGLFGVLVLVSAVMR